MHNDDQTCMEKYHESMVRKALVTQSDTIVLKSSR